MENIPNLENIKSKEQAAELWVAEMLRGKMTKLDAEKIVIFEDARF